MVLGWLMNLDFAGGGGAVADVSTGPQLVQVYARSRRYDYGYRYIWGALWR